MANTQVTIVDKLSAEQFKEVLPRQIRGSVNQSIIDNINTLLSDPEMAENYKENILGFANVLQEGKYKLTEYLNAVRYVSYKLLGDTNVLAYSKVFPDRIQNFTNSGYDAKKISAFVSAYNKTKLVNKIYEQTLIPAHILNAGAFQEAINTQVSIMRTSQSDKVRQEAANSLLTHLKAPQAHKVEIDVKHNENEATNDLRNAVRDLAAQQRKIIEMGGANAREIAHSQIIDVKAEEDDA